MGAQGDHGVSSTTDSLSAGARTEAERVNARIEVIDGSRLADLMLRHGVGAQAEVTVTLHQLDEDFSASHSDAASRAGPPPSDHGPARLRTSVPSGR